jgi:fermentation-respiration switch protein FrsA (DUF1100 family)
MKLAWQRRKLVRILVVTAAVCLVMALAKPVAHRTGMSMWLEEKIIFPAPRYPEGDWNPRRFSYEDVYFTSEDGTALHGWFLDCPRPRGYLLYCHANGDCVAYLGDYADQLRRQYELAVFVFDYRGYGRSAGKPHERGVMQDGRAAQRWLEDRVGRQPSDLILMGRSLGGAVAIGLAAEHGAKALILQNTFTSMVDVATFHFPYLPLGRLMRTQFNSLAAIPHYHGPVLQSHGTADEIIPYELGRRLFAAIPGPKEFFVCEGQTHNAWEPVEYDEVLRKFLARVN